MGLGDAIQLASARLGQDNPSRVRFLYLADKLNEAPKPEGFLVRIELVLHSFAQATPSPLPNEPQSHPLHAMAIRGLQGTPAGDITGCITPIVISGGVSALGRPPRGWLSLESRSVGARSCSERRIDPRRTLTLFQQNCQLLEWSSCIPWHIRTIRS